MEFLQQLDPLLSKLRNTIKEHTRMNILRITYVHNGHNHNKAEHIY